MTIGIDIGGSKIRSIIWNGKSIRKYQEFRIPKSLNGLKRTLKKLIKNGERVGIGVAGIVKGTKVISATNISYLKNFDFKVLFSNFQSPISNLQIDNDARCFARAEYGIGTGKGARSTSSGQAKSMLFITLGTGIGRAYGKNGKILNIRCFEYAEDWEKDYQKIKDKNKLSKFLREKLAPIIYTLDPEIIVLGGGVVEKKGYYEAIKQSLRGEGIGARVKKSKLGKFAGAMGAAMLWNQSVHIKE